MKIRDKSGEILLEINAETLCRANLRGANLREANLRGANLREANLRGANLCEANLREANLRGANLCEANLRRANLYGADLYGADLCRANLCEANLRGAIWTNGVTFTRNPIIIDGLPYRVIILDNHVQVGCKLFTIAEAAAMTNNDAKSIDGEKAAQFVAFQSAILELAMADGRGEAT